MSEMPIRFCYFLVKVKYLLADHVAFHGKLSAALAGQVHETAHNAVAHPGI